MSNRKVVSRVTDSFMQKRDAVWTHRAKEWIHGQARQLFSMDTGEYTVADIMAKLDSQPEEDMPKGYVRVLDSSLYPKRYAMVRGVLDTMRRSGQLEAGTTVNAKGREDVTCYRKPLPACAFAVEVEGAAARPVKELLCKWLNANGQTLGGLDSILVTRVTPGGANAPEEIEIDLNSEGDDARD